MSGVAYDPQKDAHDSYYAAIEAKRLRGDAAIEREVVIGECRLLLGDARRIWPLLPAIDAVLSDPPFGMDFRSNHRAERHDEINGDSDTDLLLWACSLPASHSKYIFCRWDNLAETPKPRSLVTWVKNNWSMGDLKHEHGRQTEVMLFYPGPDHDFPAGRPSDVIEAPRTGNDHHPTEKPVQLMSAVLRWTRGLVCDPFMGSGTTGIACMHAGRPFIGIENKPQHFETACRRIRDAHARPNLFLSPRGPEPIQPPLFGPEIA